MKVVNRQERKHYEQAVANADPKLVDVESLKPVVVDLQRVPDGPPLEIGPGIVAMQGDYYGKYKEHGTIVVAAADIGEAWEEV